ncbi:hypothetical protein GGP41_008850 [Bipolaris sorokiniana]|uniref:Uncharacterized protein n=1 Tax=Cochliobolus sativus TaxID=45130 RepID=A0A8H5Z993_COCSA|nr:hypothetical protein GGP41_008850 [Bipolaris sorokiniana]
MFEVGDKCEIYAFEFVCHLSTIYPLFLSSSLSLFPTRKRLLFPPALPFVAHKSTDTHIYRHTLAYSYTPHSILPKPTDFQNPHPKKRRKEKQVPTQRKEKENKTSFPDSLHFPVSLALMHSLTNAIQTGSNPFSRKKQRHTKQNKGKEDKQDKQIRYPAVQK